VFCKFFAFYKGVHNLLMSLETEDARWKEQKAAEKHRKHEIVLLQHQITNLKERQDQLKNVVSQLSSDPVCYVIFHHHSAFCHHLSLFFCLKMI